MKLVVRVKLLPASEQASALEATLRACNAAASHVAATARKTDCYRNYDLRRHAYHEVRTEYRLGAQAAQHVVKKVCDAYRSPPGRCTADRNRPPVHVSNLPPVRLP